MCAEPALGRTLPNQTQAWPPLAIRNKLKVFFLFSHAALHAVSSGSHKLLEWHTWSVLTTHSLQYKYLGLPTHFSLEPVSSVAVTLKLTTPSVFISFIGYFWFRFFFQSASLAAQWAQHLACPLSICLTSSPGFFPKKHFALLVCLDLIWVPISTTCANSHSSERTLP